nr:Protein SMG8 [Ipomoea batatas]
MDRPFRIENLEFGDEIKSWFRFRDISYYHDEEKGILYLQYSSIDCPALEGNMESRMGFDSVLEDYEFGDLQAMLFIFSVCHVVIFIQEGSHFDTPTLKKFRILQAAKNAMSPFVKSQTVPPSASGSRFSSPSRTSISESLSNNNSPVNSRGILSRNTSAITLMPGLGSYASLLPGQCTPVTLFVYLDDFLDSIPGSSVEKPPEISSVNQSSSLSSLLRPNLPTKGPGSVVVLARPVNETEGGFRKKLQSSLEAQIRFSIKKCRTLSGSENSHRARSGAMSNSAPLFSLDASKAVVLVDISSIQKGESLEFATSVVEDIISGKASSDALLLECHSQSGNREDILSVKEFICRQLDILRGRGAWFPIAIVVQLLALACKRKPRRQNSVSPPIERSASKVSDPLETAVSYLSSGRGLNARFSTLWCQKALPVAKEGPAVQLYMKKLEDECTAIWSSGRQLCDAISLTGKPCMHRRHEDETGTLHSSGYVFLHACACGRSRRLRSDPFDFESANVTFNGSMDCDKLLPMLQPPRGSVIGPVQPSSWSLVRVGNARYYQPSKGLIQSGFSATEKFLSKWSILLEKPKVLNAPLPSNFQQASSNLFHSESKDDTNPDTMVDQVGAIRLHDKEMRTEVKMQRKSSLGDIRGEDKTNSFSKKLSNFTMRKPFSEVVAGSANPDSAFPPLQSKAQTQPSIAKGMKQQSDKDGAREKVSEITDAEESEKVGAIPAVDEAVNGNVTLSNGFSKVNRFSEIDSDIFPMHINSGAKTKTVTSLKHVTIYIGFEHECPHGHRFILSSDHLKELGSPYLVTEDSTTALEREDHKLAEHPKAGKNGHGKGRRQSNGIISAASSRVRNLEKSKERTDNGYAYLDGSMQPSKPPKEQPSMMIDAASRKDLEPRLQSHSLAGTGYTFPLLNRNLPLYMNCPHCMNLKNKKDETDAKFAGSVSQLQRIFMVTPPFPVVLAACPIIQFEVSCLPPSVPDRETKLQFSLSCPVVLAPDSFLSLRLPFVYGVQLEDGSLHPLKPFEHQPELTAWITSGTTLKVPLSSWNLKESTTVDLPHFGRLFELQLRVKHKCGTPRVDIGLRRSRSSLQICCSVPAVGDSCLRRKISPTAHLQ